MAFARGPFLFYNSPMNAKELRDLIPAKYFEISEARSWGTLIRLLICLSIVLFLETKADSFLALTLLWFFHGQILVGFFVLGHDCGHHSFSNSRLINQFVGLISLAPLGNGYFTWQRTHNTHHAKTQLKGVDIDWSSWLVAKRKITWSEPVRKIGYILPFGVFWFVFVNAIRRGFEKSTFKEKFSNLVMWLSIIGLYAVLYKNFGLWGLLKFHVVPATIAMFTGYFLLTIQHANESAKWYSKKDWEFYKAQFGSTYDVRFPRLLEWFWLDINIHVPHHLFPQIPWYHLRECSLILKQKFPEHYKERKISMKEITWMLKTPYMKEVENGCAVLDQRLE